MAIQIPNAGTGNGATGDNEFVLWTKVINNFSDQTNAASKLVGVGTGQIPLAQNTLKASLNHTPVDMRSQGSSYDLNYAVAGDVVVVSGENVNAPPVDQYALVMTLTSYLNARFVQMAWHRLSGALYTRAKSGTAYDQWSDWLKYYHTGNTTKDSNGFIKASSPVIDLYDNDFKLNTDAQQQNITVTKNGAGDYTIKTDTGLRSDNTWRIELPNDDNRNPLFAVDIDAQNDGTINIKCYKRIFDMSTFTFVPDLNEPMDITEGRFISVRLNDNPETEQLDEPIE